MIVPPKDLRSAIIRSLRSGVRTYYHTRPLRKPAQRTPDQYIRFYNYCFIHRARVVPLNKTHRFDNTIRMGGKLFITCQSTAGLRSLFPLIMSQQMTKLPFDLTSWIWRDERSKRIHIIDVCVPFDGSSEVLKTARLEKLKKYNDLANELRLLGWDVYLDGFIVEPEMFNPKCPLLISKESHF